MAAFGQRPWGFPRKRVGQAPCITLDSLARYFDAQAEYLNTKKRRYALQIGETLKGRRRKIATRQQRKMKQ